MGFCGTLRHREFYIRVCDAIFHRQRSLTISTVPFSALIVIVMQGVGGGGEVNGSFSRSNQFGCARKCDKSFGLFICIFLHLFLVCNSIAS